MLTYAHALELWSEHAFYNVQHMIKPHARARWPMNVLVRYEDLVRFPFETMASLWDFGLAVDLGKLQSAEQRKWWGAHKNAVENLGCSSRDASFREDREWAKQYLQDNHALLLNHLKYEL